MKSSPQPRFLVASILLFLSSVVIGQSSLGLHFLQTNTVAYEEMPAVSNDSLRIFFDKQPKEESNAFAKNFPTHVSTHHQGVWFDDSLGFRHWLCGFASRGAFSLNFILSGCRFPQGAKLYVLNQDSRSVYGPLSIKHVSNDSTLYIEPVLGDMLLLEFVVHQSFRQDEYFTVSSVGHDFRDYYGTAEGTRGTSGSCEIDFVCQGKGWENERRGVVRYTYFDGLFTRNCTGTLVNNTKNDGIPYIITANHCIPDQKTAATTVFYFNFEKTTCKGIKPSSWHQLMRGATLVATTLETTKIDFSLLKLSAIPPDVYKVYYNGWTLSNVSEDSVVCIHHPEGDMRKISKSHGFVKTATFESFAKGSMWNVATWNVGVTEGGSSGSALFNKKHQIIGMLSGGASSCANVKNDYFTKFNAGWSFYPDSSNQLKYWLAPGAANGVVSCDPLDMGMLYENPLSNLVSSDSLVVLSFGKQASGAISGYNNVGFTGCAEKFTGVLNQYVYGLRFPVAVLGDVSSMSKIRLKIWSGTDSPGKLLYETLLDKDSVLGKTMCQIRLKNHVFIGSNAFVGFEYEGLTARDSVFLFVAKNREQYKTNTLYVKYKNDWLKADYIGLNSSLGLELFVSNHESELVPVSSLDNRWSGRLLNQFRPFSSKELFQKDSLSNINEHEALTLYRFNGSDGFMTGTNKFDIKRFAEKILMKDFTYISGMKIIPYISSSTHAPVGCKLRVWNGTSVPDSLLYSADVMLAGGDKRYCNVVKFNKNIKVDSVCFIGYELFDTAPADTCAVYMGKPVVQQFLHHSFFYSADSWVNFTTFGVPDALALSLYTCYSKCYFENDSLNFVYPLSSTVRYSNYVETRVVAYPNLLASGSVIYVNAGKEIKGHVTISVFDAQGRNMYELVPSVHWMNVLSFNIGSLAQGLYYSQVNIDGIRCTQFTFIVK